MHGNRATFSYSLDGTKWDRIGPEFTLTFGRWRGDRIGFFCWNETEANGQIDIDWFHYEYDGPRSFGPLSSECAGEAPTQ